MIYLFSISWAWLHEKDPHTLIGSIEDCQAVWDLLHSGAGPNVLAFSRIHPVTGGSPAREYLADPVLLTAPGGGLE